MLFHPKEPKKILGFTFHGIFPKRQKQFAAKLGKVVSTELISFEDIKSQLAKPENLDSVMPIIEAKLDHFIKKKLSEKMPVISMFISNNTLDDIKSAIVLELKDSLPMMIEQMSNGFKDKLDIEQLVIQKVENFSSDKLEQILVDIMNKEFKFVEIIGGVIGLIIGIIQVILGSLL
jgi:uncharacterized membrane protein YheB (UPF0754 family)